MAKNKYYDHLKPQLPQQSFSDIVEQQLGIIQQQQQARAAQDMQIQKARQKSFESQQKELLGFDVSDMSEVDKQTFGTKRDWLKGRIDDYYYNPSNYGEFVEDVNSLKGLHGTLKNHTENTKTGRNNLEGWVSGTKQWTDKDLELKDNMNTLNAKRQMWEMSGIDPESMQIDPNTGDTYAFYTDINGNRMKDESGQDMFGLASDAPSRGSQEYFSPTASPYANMMPGSFSKDFSAAARRLKNNPNMSMEEKMGTLRSWVTTEATQNQSVMATANNQFMENYGGSAQAAMTQDAQNDPGDGSYVPIQMREYIDETMKFLEGNLAESDSDDSGSPSAAPTPTTVRFDMGQFQSMAPNMFGSIVPDPSFGEGITNLMVPRKGVGASSIMIPRSYQPQDESDPRFNEVSDQYKAKALAMDTNKNIFVQAEMYFEAGEEELPPELAARRANLLAMGFATEAAKATRVKRTVPIVVSPTIVVDGTTIRNPEYLSILAQIAYVKGYKIEDQVDAAAKGMDILELFNDEQAQIAAALPGN